MQDQEDTFTDLMSTNEDADLADTIINLTSANNVYQASLNAASKVVKNTLMDFI
jgi:flagellar hook-associated protein 3 FlgL